MICLDEKMGLTSDDVYEHLVHNHELISIEELIREVSTVLNGVELNSKGIFCPHSRPAPTEEQDVKSL